MDAQTPQTRQIKITGGAAADYHKVKRGGSRKVPKTQRGGDEAPPPQMPVTPLNVAAVRKMVNSMKGGAVFSASIHDGSAAPILQDPPATMKVPAVQPNLHAVTAPVYSTVPMAPPLPPPPLPPPQAGGKLTLVPSKKKSRSRVLLAPPASTKSSKLRETRKIRVQLSGLKKRLTKAKAIHKDSREKTIADVRKILEEAKLVKPAKEGKTVPDSVLRDIYKDYLLLRNRAL